MGILSDLADRVETLVGPDRSIDVEIWNVAEAPQPPLKRRNEHFDDRWCSYTASLDAAMALVPEGLWLEATLYLIPGRRSVFYVRNPEGSLPIAMGDGESPALAITAAALRAKEALGND